MWNFTWWCWLFNPGCRFLFDRNTAFRKVHWSIVLVYNACRPDCFLRVRVVSCVFLWHKSFDAERENGRRNCAIRRRWPWTANIPIITSRGHFPFKMSRNHSGIKQIYSTWKLRGNALTCRRSLSLHSTLNKLQKVTRPSKVWANHRSVRGCVSKPTESPI